MLFNFNTLFKYLLELRFENHNKNISFLKKYDEQNSLLQKEFVANERESLDYLINSYQIKQVELISGNKIHFESISSPNITQWQKKTTPSPVKAAFITHALSESLKDLNEEEFNKAFAFLQDHLDLEKMNLIGLNTIEERYFFFFNLLRAAYFDGLILKQSENKALNEPQMHMGSNKHKSLFKQHRTSLIMFATLILIVVLFTINMSHDAYIEFNDPVLEAVMKREVEGALGKKIEGDIKKEDALLVNSVTYDIKNKKTTQWNNDQPITDLTGLQFFKNLVIVNFRGNQIAEIGALKDLKKIEQLYIGSNNILSIEPLTNLRTLKRLAIDGNYGVKTISGIEHLSALELLNLSYIDVDDISPILELNNLKYLYLLGPTKADLSVIGKHNIIEDLYLDNTKSQMGYNFIGEMKGLKHLNISQNDIENIDFIDELFFLEGLDVRENKIKDITPILNLEGHKEIEKSAMKFLKLDHNQIDSIEGIGQFKELQRLTLTGNSIDTLNEAYMLFARNMNLEKDFEIELEDFGSAITNAHDEVWYVFKPKETDFYSFFTMSDGKMQGAIFDDQREKLFSGWYNEGESIRFYTEGECISGQTYLIKIRAHGETLTPYHFYLVGKKNQVDSEELQILGIENHFVQK